MGNNNLQISITEMPHTDNVEGSSCKFDLSAACDEQEDLKNTASELDGE